MTPNINAFLDELGTSNPTCKRISHRPANGALKVFVMPWWQSVPMSEPQCSGFTRGSVGRFPKMNPCRLAAQARRHANLLDFSRAFCAALLHLLHLKNCRQRNSRLPMNSIVVSDPEVLRRRWFDQPLEVIEHGGLIPEGNGAIIALTAAGHVSQRAATARSPAQNAKQ